MSAKGDWGSWPLIFPLMDNHAKLAVCETIWTCIAEMNTPIFPIFTDILLVLFTVSCLVRGLFAAMAYATVCSTLYRIHVKMAKHITADQKL